MNTRVRVGGEERRRRVGLGFLGDNWLVSASSSTLTVRRLDSPVREEGRKDREEKIE